MPGRISDKFHVGYHRAASHCRALAAALLPREQARRTTSASHQQLAEQRARRHRRLQLRQRNGSEGFLPRIVDLELLTNP